MKPLFSKDYDIAFETRRDYLHVRVALPANNYNAARQYWTEIVRMINKLRCVRAAIEISANAALPASDAKGLMSDLLKMIYPGLRIAIINPLVADEVRFFIEASADRQRRSMKFFNDLTAAENWLREDQLNFAPAALGSYVQDLTEMTRLQ